MSSKVHDRLRYLGVDCERYTGLGRTDPGTLQGIEGKKRQFAWDGYGLLLRFASFVSSRIIHVTLFLRIFSHLIALPRFAYVVQFFYPY